MSKKLLIVTPHKSFGELLSSNLDRGEFNTVISHSANQALEITEIDLVILDADIAEITLDNFLQALLEKFPHLGTIVIHSLDQQISIKENLKDRVILLIRPFDLAELLESLGEISRQQTNAATDNPNFYQPEQAAADNWLTDTASVHDRLKDSVFSPMIREALLISPENPLVSTLPPDEDPSTIFVETVRAHMDSERSSTLIKFVNLSGMDNLLMAKNYPDTGTLAVLFNPAVKFTQATKMLDEMAARVAGNFSITGHESLTYEKETVRTPPGQPFDGDQNGGVTTPGWIPEVDLEPSSPVETEPLTISYPWDPGFVSPREEPLDIESGKPNVPSDPENSIPVIDIESREHEGTMLDSKDTVSGASLHAGDGKLSLDVDTKRIANQRDSSPENLSTPMKEADESALVSYSFLLISNYPQYRLVDETARVLEEEIRAACQDNGWFLLFLETHQDYIQLSVRVPEAVPPALIVKLIRQKTTNMLLGGFTEFEKEQIEGDFWASGQLITDGSNPEIV